MSVTAGEGAAGVAVGADLAGIGVGDPDLVFDVGGGGGEDPEILVEAAAVEHLDHHFPVVRAEEGENSRLRRRRRRAGRGRSRRRRPIRSGPRSGRPAGRAGRPGSWVGAAASGSSRSSGGGRRRWWRRRRAGRRRLRNGWDRAGIAGPFVGQEEGAFQAAVGDPGLAGRAPRRRATPRSGRRAARRIPAAACPPGRAAGRASRRVPAALPSEVHSSSPRPAISTAR